MVTGGLSSEEMITLLYHAKTVGPVCERLAKVGGFKVLRDLSSTNISGTILRWGSVIPLLRYEGRVFNSNDAVSLSRNKKASRQVLLDLSPTTWYGLTDVRTPCVIRPRRHHGGYKFFVCNNSTEVLRATKRCRLGWYATELVDKAEEYRVFVLQGRTVCVSQRFPGQHAIAWNLGMGGRLINVEKNEWPKIVVIAAINATKRLGLDWAAIDVATAKDGRTVVFEANTAPGLRNKYTINRIAKALSWADKNPPPPEAKGDTWKNLLHPGLTH